MYLIVKWNTLSCNSNYLILIGRRIDVICPDSIRLECCTIGCHKSAVVCTIIWKLRNCVTLCIEPLIPLLLLRPTPATNTVLMCQQFFKRFVQQNENVYTCKNLVLNNVGGVDLKPQQIFSSHESQ